MNFSSMANSVMLAAIGPLSLSHLHNINAADSVREIVCLLHVVFLYAWLKQCTKAAQREMGRSRELSARGERAQLIKLFYQRYQSRTR